MRVAGLVISLSAALALTTTGLSVQPAGAAAQRHAVAVAPSSTFPPLGSWLPVFADEFDGTFNGQPIVDTKNVRGAAGPDGIDDRVWLPTDYTNAGGLSVTNGAAGGDAGQPADGYLNFRVYSENGQVVNPDWLRTGNNEGTRRAPFESTYGYVEARLSMVQAEGANEAFFMYSRDLHQNYSQPLRDPANAGIEVDIMEEWGTDQVHHNIHWDGYAESHRVEGSRGRSCPGSVCQGNFHTYGVLWGPDGYRFFIDGEETWYQAVGVSHRPHFLMLGAAFDRPGLDLGPKGDPRNALMLVDHVKIWQPAVSDIGNLAVGRNVAAAVPFQVSSVASDVAPLPGPRVASVEAVSSNQAVVRSADLTVYGTGADRSLALLGGQAGTTTVTVRARDAAGTVLGSDQFTVTVSGAPASVPVLGSGPAPALAITGDRPAALTFQTPATEGSAPTVTVRSSNRYLVPDANLGLTGSGRVRTLAATPLPTRSGTADLTVTVRDPADGSTSTHVVTLSVVLGQVANGGLESGALTPWTLLGGAAPVVRSAAARTGSWGLHVDVAAVTQRIVVEPGTTYAVGGWGRTSAAGGLFDLGILDTNTYPDGDFDGRQTVSTRFDSTSWARKEVVFTTGPHTRFVEVVVTNAFLSGTGFDVDDLYLVDAPKISQIPDQSIGHSTCVVPKVYVGRVGDPGDGWTLSAAVTGGDTGLVTASSVVATGGANPYERGVKITPTADQTRSGSATVTLTAQDREGRRSTDSFTVWVNAGSFRNGSFEHDPVGDYAYTGCGTVPRAWNHFFAPNARSEVLAPYDWKYGSKNLGLRLRQVTSTNGTPYGGWVFQDVTGLQPNTEYVLSGRLGLEAGGATVADGAALKVEGDVTPIAPAGGRVARVEHGWSGELTIRFRTGAAGTARVVLIAPNHPTYTGMFHDITLLRA